MQSHHSLPAFPYWDVTLEKRLARPTSRRGRGHPQRLGVHDRQYDIYPDQLEVLIHNTQDKPNGAASEGKYRRHRSVIASAIAG